MRKYEFVYILGPSLDESAVSQNLEKYLKIIKDRGGEVTHQETWGRRKFTYEINHMIEGTYLYIRMKATPEIVAELNRVLRFDEGVVRTLIVLDEEWERRNEEASRRAEPAAPSPAPAAAS